MRITGHVDYGIPHPEAPAPNTSVIRNRSGLYPRWSPAEVELLRRNWANLPAAKLVKLFKGRNRNSILGKAFRLKLSRKRRPNESV